MERAVEEEGMAGAKVWRLESTMKLPEIVRRPAEITEGSA